MSSEVAETGNKIQTVDFGTENARLAKPSCSDGPAVIAGWWLHDERMQRGATIEEASRATRIEPALIEAIETGQLEKLPERSQALDMIRAYADFLKLEPGPLCSHFDKLLPVTAPDLLSRLRTDGVKGIGTAMMARFALPKLATGQMIGAAFVCFMVFGAFGAFAYTVLPGVQGSVDNDVTAEVVDRRPVEKTSGKTKIEMNGQVQFDPTLNGLAELIERTVPEAETKKPDAIKTATKLPTEVERVDKKIVRNAETGGRLYGAGNKNSRLLIQAKSRVWVRIEDDNGNVVLNQTLLSGDAFKVPNRKGLVLIARNGGALVYSLDGEKKGAIGTLGEILVGHPLDPEKIGQSS